MKLFVALFLPMMALATTRVAPNSGSSGQAWAWGNNLSGQIGLNSSTAIPAPQVVSGLKGVVTVSAGYDFVLAVTASGHVWSWGDEADGRLGNGQTSYAAVPTPRQISGLSQIRQISAGYDQALALTKSGRVYAWGSDQGGDLGVPSNSQCNCVDVPTEIPDLQNVAQVSVGGGFSDCKDCASEFSVALKSDGTVWAWGTNGEGELGADPGSTYISTVPRRIRGLTDVIAIAAGAGHVLALTKAGKVWTWGDDQYGQLGDGAFCGPYNCLSWTPSQVPGLTSIRLIAAGGNDSAAITAKGEVWTWGDSYDDQLGDGVSCSSQTNRNCASNRPVHVVHLHHIIGIAVGSSHMIALRSDHSVWCWGDNLWDELGRPSPPYPNSPIPETPGTNQDQTKQVSAGYGFSVALRNAG
ncbi:MAG TPA: hypothetical protein VG815_07750 [Chloroflexota bacterium]|jgi:alpha-tubulin suppressor-like RCC1 family protein|nr:hypothetical protein [Chloroflexota bacterium]